MTRGDPVRERRAIEARRITFVFFAIGSLIIAITTGIVEHDAAIGANLAAGLGLILVVSLPFCDWIVPPSARVGARGRRLTAVAVVLSAAAWIAIGTSVRGAGGALLSVLPAVCCAGAAVWVTASASAPAHPGDEVRAKHTR